MTIKTPAVLIDSHCHLNFPDLQQNLPAIFSLMRENSVAAALCVGVNLEDFPQVLKIAEEHAHIYASVGVHPDYEGVHEPNVDELLQLAAQPKVIAIGETGLDYFRLQGNLEWQRDRFRTHIRAATACNKPLIVHTREAADDTLRILREEGAHRGVMHCFTENLEVAREALELGFYISFSGIVSFNKALQVKEVAKMVPLDRILVETDSPYLAPAPFRGKTNQPGYVRHVAIEIARLKGISLDEVANATTANFCRLFGVDLTET